MNSIIKCIFRRTKVSIAIIFVLTIFLTLFSPYLAFSQEKLSPPSKSETPVLEKIDGYPVELGGEFLFKIQEGMGPFSAQERVQAINERLSAIAENHDIDINDLTINNQDDWTSLNISDRTILTVTNADAKAAHRTRHLLSEELSLKIKTAILQYRQARLPNTRIWATFSTIISTASVFILIALINWVFSAIQRLKDFSHSSIILSLRIQNFDLLTSRQVENILDVLLKILRIIAYLAIFYLYIPTVLSFFPATRKVGQNLFKYLLNTLSLMGNGFLNYLPNIVTISLIIVFTHYLLRFIKLFFGQIERGNIRFMGFYQEWAKPTYQICSIILIAVTAAIIFPYLPGFQSPAFQGISVFFGILISLGSTSIIANTIAGIVLLYTRSFQLGDYVQIEEIVGHVEDKNPFVIRIRTSKNVLVVLPNATVLNGKVTNFSLSARDTGIPLSLHTTITLGYHAPWRKVHEALIQAARDCPSIVPDPAPFVLQTSLDDFYVNYQLNASGQTHLNSRLLI